MPLGIWELATLLFVCGVPLLLGIVFVAVLVSRTKSTAASQPDTRSPLEILQERYARGEIDSEEYEDRKQRLLGDS